LDAPEPEILVRLGNRRNNDPHQAGFLAADAGEHTIDEADAGVTARDQETAGEVQGRPAKAKSKAIGVLAKEQGEPNGRLFADVAANSGVLRFSDDDSQRDRTAGRAMALG